MHSISQFSRYLSVGVFNSAVHVVIFLLLIDAAGFGQASANGVAFTVAATTSYLLNSRLTFRARYSFKRYVWFCLGMAVIAMAIGAMVQWLIWPPVVTLIVFSGVSALVGYWYSANVVFQKV